MSQASGANPHPPAGSIRVRPAQLSDADRLAEINTRAWQIAYRGIVPDDYLDSLQVNVAAVRWRQRIASPPEGATTLVAEDGGAVAAYVVGGRYRAQQDALAEDTRGWAELWAIYADPDMRGRGAGRAVHDALLAVLADQGWRSAALWVLRDNAASRAWYARRGWRPDGATSDWLGSGTPLTEIRLVRPLAPSSAEWEFRGALH